MDVDERKVDSCVEVLTNKTDGQQFEVIRYKENIDYPILHSQILISSAFWLANALYIYVLVHNVIRAPSVPAWLFVISQILSNIEELTDGLWNLAVEATRRTSVRPKYRLRGSYPTVDVFITACNEPTDVISDTVTAACTMSYPKERFRVIVCDDGNDKQLQESVRKLRHKYTNLAYYARRKSADRPHGYKAGNLNSAIIALRQKAEYVSVFDADMIPDPDFLIALLPHIMADEKIGIVNCAQQYYNLPNGDPLCQGNYTGVKANDGLRELVNCSWTSGSGFIFRREAWESINGFPTFSVVEDLMTSWLLQGSKWSVVLVHDLLQWGFQPDCMLTNIEQHRRWWTGQVKDSFTLNFTFDHRLAGATTMQRIAMIKHCLHPWLSTVARLMAMGMMLISFMWGQVLALPDHASLGIVLTLVIIQNLIWAWGDLMAIRSGFFWNNRQHVATGKWKGIHYARDVIAISLGRQIPRFNATGAKASHSEVCKERYANIRPPPWKRLWIVSQQEGIWKYGALFVLFILAAVYRLIADLSHCQNSGDDVHLRVIASVGFPGLYIINTVPFFLTPLVYILFPPTVPSRRTLLVHDDHTQVWRVRESSKSIRWTHTSWWLEIPHIVATAWLCYTIYHVFLRDFSAQYCGTLAAALLSYTVQLIRDIIVLVVSVASLFYFFAHIQMATPSACGPPLTPVDGSIVGRRLFDWRKVDTGTDIPTMVANEPPLEVTPS